jgi:hypothetical protein
MTKLTINRAPVLTLWAAVVAERLGFDRAESLTLGKALAGLNAQSKGRRLGIFKPIKQTATRAKKRDLAPGKRIDIELMRRGVPAVRTKEGLRALVKDRAIDPEAVTKYLEGKFGDDLPAVRKAMTELARSRSVEELAEEAYALYEAFRPEIPGGKRGWGAAGVLDLDWIRSM